MRKLAVICMTALVAALFAACGVSGPDGGAVDVYYAVTLRDQTALPAQTIRAERAALPEHAQPLVFAMEKLVAGPGDDALRSAFPKGTAALGVHVEDGTGCAVVALSEGWLEASGLDKTLAEYCLLKTALQFEGVTSAAWEVFAADGRLVSGPVLREDAYIDAPLVLVPARHEIVLYFSDGGGLVPETRSVVLRESESEEWYRQVIDGLIAGPLAAGSAPVMPPRARVLSVSMENRVVCVVNFSREFVTGATGDVQDAQLTLGALVYSLTELPGVNFLKIRVEGEDLTDYCGIDVSLPLERADSVLSYA